MKVIIYNDLMDMLYRMRDRALKEGKDMAYIAIDRMIDITHLLPTYEWSGVDEIISNSPLD